MTHDSGAGDRVGCFQSRVIGVGPQNQRDRQNGAANVLFYLAVGDRFFGPVSRLRYSDGYHSGLSEFQSL
jgi:hypothetical protein